MNAVSSFLYHWCINHPQLWYPLLSVYYLTYACKLRCPYCSDGAGHPYPQLRSETLPRHEVLALLKIIRGHSDYLVITGGEPLDHPDCREVLKGLAALKFRGVILTTNGCELEHYLAEVAGVVSHLVISLQTMNPEIGDRWYGRTGTHKRVMANITRAASYPGRKYEFIISSVVTPENIPDLYEVYGFAKANGLRLAACPQLVGVKAHSRLAGNPEYQRFFDFLIAEKRNGGSIQGTVDYLEYMRDLQKFSCRPFTMLVVSPTGNVFYPCLELGQFAGNLLQEPNLHRLRAKGAELFGPQPDCDTRCHSACALGFSRLLANPVSALHEGLLEARAAVKKFL